MGEFKFSDEVVSSSLGLLLRLSRYFLFNNHSLDLKIWYYVSHAAAYDSLPGDQIYVRFFNFDSGHLALE